YALNQAISAVFALIHHGKILLVVLIFKHEKLVLQEVHLENRLLHGHGLNRELFGTDNLKLVRLLRFLIELICNRLFLKDALTQALFKAGLVLSNLTLNSGHSGIN